MLQKKNQQKKARGVFSKHGVQIATRPTKQPSSLGELGGKLLLHFPINIGRREEQKCSTPLVSEDHLKLVRKIVSGKKIQAEALP